MSTTHQVLGADSRGTSIATVFQCPGVVVDWTPGSVWNTYPFQQHDLSRVKLPWEIIGWEMNGQLRLRSAHCQAPKFAPVQHTCPTCAFIPYSSRYRQFMQSNADDAKPHTTLEYLNYRQLLAVTRSALEKNRRLTVKVRRFKS